MIIFKKYIDINENLPTTTYESWDSCSEQEQQRLDHKGGEYL